jgi:hypothetical protein
VFFVAIPERARRAILRERQRVKDLRAALVAVLLPQKTQEGTKNEVG